MMNPVRSSRAAVLWTHDKVVSATSNGINFLAKGQEKDGSFESFISADLFNFKKARKQQIVFLNILILSCLNSLEETPGIKSIKGKLVKFLLSQKSVHWSFNYLARDSTEAKTNPYPDDLDDTFCALSAIYEYDPSLIDGKVLAKAVTVLTALEEKEGGPYRTWLVPATASAVWQDVDLAVNANIAYFLSLQDIDLPNIIGLIESAVHKTKYVSPYYPNEYAIIYFISRFYKGNNSRKIIDFLLKGQGRNYWGNSMNAALAISSLINLGFSAGKLKKAVNNLLNKQKNSAWPPFGFCIDHIIKNEKHYAGSSFITTALCLEAIQKFNKSQIPNPKSQINSKSQISNSKKEEGKIYNNILKEYRRRFSGFSKDFQEKAVAEALKILNKNKDIVLLPYYFAKSLGRNFNSKFLIHNSDLLIRLGEANLFGWIAYTIYDDFLDEEGDPKGLPLANVCLRESAEIFGAVLPYATGFPTFSKKIFDTIDGANMWEVTNCRFDIKNKQLAPTPKILVWELANKSLGHALGPMAILFELGYKAHSAEVRNTMRFFRNYIIARQLNDDAHDWEDDLKRGQVNAVGARLLSTIGGSAVGGKDTRGKTSGIEKLREVFWRKTVVGACKDILRHVELAKKDIEKLSIIEEPKIFVEMLYTIERSVEEALKEREETMKFLKTYSSPRLS